MFRKLSVAGLVAGAAIGMALSAAPAHASDYSGNGHDEQPPVTIINAQKQTQEANAEATSENLNVNDNEAEAEAEAVADGLLEVSADLGDLL
ncbi:hypothetical protein [Streptomonospora wellingtoniae]|uniref:Uncharacterized protein n=1 Tax=Streptomonospora wellingtoniae TaxID=3075544 RepID=A0ABU2KMK0_9ACTN|nr:hypothetical protein [Streptomonospora sp. DSM 45055]MDT0300497.1 hypothetical protein [Streptomonospora sp. DSM 45055]